MPSLGFGEKYYMWHSDIPLMLFWHRIIAAVGIARFIEFSLYGPYGKWLLDCAEWKFSLVNHLYDRLLRLRVLFLSTGLALQCLMTNEAVQLDHVNYSLCFVDVGFFSTLPTLYRLQLCSMQQNLSLVQHILKIYFSYTWQVIVW